jgi:hypothetical protein
MATPKERFTIEVCPKAFLPLAKKHNALARHVGGIMGKNGIRVTTGDEQIDIMSDGPMIFAVGPLGTLLPVAQYYPADVVALWEKYYPRVLKTKTDLKTVTLDETGITATDGTKSIVANFTTGLVVSDGTYSATIDFATLTSKAKNLTFREIDVCDSGTMKKMLVLGSAPY